MAAAASTHGTALVRRVSKRSTANDACSGYLIIPSFDFWARARVQGKVFGAHLHDTPPSNDGYSVFPL